MRPVTLTASSSSSAAMAASAVSSDPVLLTFGTNVYTTDVRITVSVQKRKTRRKRKKQHSHYDEWTISILNSQRADEAIYECQQRGSQIGMVMMVKKADSFDTS